MFAFSILGFKSVQTGFAGREANFSQSLKKRRAGEQETFDKSLEKLAGGSLKAAEALRYELEL